MLYLVDSFTTRSNENNFQNNPAIVTQWLGENTFLETQYFLHEAIYDPSKATDSKTGYTKKLAEARDKK